MKMTTKIKTRLNFPKFDFQEHVEYIAEKIVIPGIEGGINRGVALDGGGFPKLEASTIRMKGHSRPLINTSKLRNGIFWKKAGGIGSSGVLITIKEDRKDIGGYLQVEGVRSRSGRKHFNFFGINSKMEALARAYMKRVINKAIANG